MKIKVWTLVLVFSFFVCTVNLGAKERRGAELVITKNDGQQITGELIAVKPSSLLLLASQSIYGVSVEMKDIKIIRIVNRTKVGKGAVNGLSAGAIVGATIAAIDSGNVQSHEVFEYIVASALFVAVPAALIGIGTEILFSKDKTIHLEGKSPDETKGILETLRRKSRIPNAQ